MLSNVRILGLPPKEITFVKASGATFNQGDFAWASSSGLLLPSALKTTLGLTTQAACQRAFAQAYVGQVDCTSLSTDTDPVSVAPASLVECPLVAPATVNYGDMVAIGWDSTNNVLFDSQVQTTTDPTQQIGISLSAGTNLASIRILLQTKHSTQNLIQDPGGATTGVYHVSPAGDDFSGDGSATRPLATIGAGLTHASANNVIILHPGVYNETPVISKPVIIIADPPFSGAGGSVTIQAAATGGPVVTLGVFTGTAVLQGVTVTNLGTGTSTCAVGIASAYSNLQPVYVVDSLLQTPNDNASNSVLISALGNNHYNVVLQGLILPNNVNVVSGTGTGNHFIEIRDCFGTATYTMNDQNTGSEMSIHGGQGTNLTQTNGAVCAWGTDFSLGTLTGTIFGAYSTGVGQWAIVSAASISNSPLTLCQLESNQTFVNFMGVLDNTGTKPLSSDTNSTSNKVGSISITIEGTKRWLRFYDAHN